MLSRSNPADSDCCYADVTSIMTVEEVKKVCYKKSKKWRFYEKFEKKFEDVEKEKRTVG